MGALLLTGQQESGPGPAEELRRLTRLHEELKSENAMLEAQVAQLKGELNRAQGAITALRHALKPQFMALRAIFGEIEAAGFADSPAESSSGATGGDQAKWENLKKRFGGKTAGLIDLLLIHDELGVEQIKKLLQCSQQTVYNIASALQGFIVNNRGKYSLKR